MSISGYDTQGPYHSGLWLVADSNGQHVGVVDHSHLPAQQSGVKFYWLGTAREQQMASLFDAFGKWGVKFDPNMNFGTTVDTASQKGTVAVTTPTGLSGWLSGLKYAAGNSFVTGPLTSVGDALAGGATEGAAGAGAVGAAGAGAAAANAAKALVGGLTVGALFSNPSLWAGIGMALLGAFLVLFGIMKLAGADPKQVAKKVIR